MLPVLCPGHKGTLSLWAMMTDSISCIYVCAITDNNQLYLMSDPQLVVMKSHQVRVSEPWLPSNPLE